MPFLLSRYRVQNSGGGPLVCRVFGRGGAKPCQEPSAAQGNLFIFVGWLEPQMESWGVICVICVIQMEACAAGRGTTACPKQIAIISALCKRSCELICLSKKLKVTLDHKRRTVVLHLC